MQGNKYAVSHVIKALISNAVKQRNKNHIKQSTQRSGSNDLLAHILDLICFEKIKKQNSYILLYNSH